MIRNQFLHREAAHAVAALWEPLTSPATSIASPEVRRRARLLAILLVTLIPLAVLGISQRRAAGVAIPALEATLPVFVLAYALSRTHHFRMAALLTIGAFFIMPYIAVLTPTPDFSHLSVTKSFVWSIAAVLMSSLLFSLRATLMVMAANGVAMLLFAWLIPGLSLDQLFFPLHFGGVLSLLVAVAAFVRQADRLERLRAEGAQHFYADRLSALREIDRAILAAESLEAVAQSVLAHLKQLVPYYRASVVVFYDALGEALVIATQLPGESRVAVGTRIPLESYAIRTSLRQGKPFIVEDAAAIPEPSPTQRQLFAEGLRSYIIMPLYSRGLLIGTLNLGSDKPSTFTSEHQEVAAQVAGPLAIAIQNAQLYDAERKQNQQLETLSRASLHLTASLELQRVLQAIVEYAIQLVPADNAHLFTQDGGRITLGAATWGEGRPRLLLDQPRPHGVTHSVLNTGERVVIPDVNQHPLFQDRPFGGAVVGLPLRIGQQVIGVLNVAYDRPHTFQEGELRILDLLADQAAIAIQNARLHEQVQAHAVELQAKTESLAAINAIADTLYRFLDLNRLVERALDSVMTYTQVPAATIFGVDEATRTLRVLAARGMDEAFYRLIRVTPLEGSFNGLAVMRKEMITTMDVGVDERVYNPARAPLAEHGIKAAVAVPLLFQDHVLGTISLMYQEAHILTPQERETLISIGKTIGLAMANAQYVAQIEAEVNERRRAEEAERDQRLLAEALADTAAALNSTLDLDEVLERILTHAAQLVPHDKSNIMLIRDGVAYAVRHRGYVERGLGEGIMALRLTVNEIRNLQEMVQSGRPMVIPDTAEYPGWVDVPEFPAERSYIGAPIHSEGQVVGFLHLTSSTPQTFTPAHVQLLQALAHHASIAMQNARLYDASRRHASELEQRVTERTAELDQERAELKTILDAMSEGVIYHEGQQIHYTNEALRFLTGYAAEEWQRFPDDLFARATTSAEQDEELGSRIRDYLTQYGIWDGEMRLRRRDGVEFDAALTCNRVYLLDSSILAAVTIIRDVSQEKALQAQKARFVANASHELRTPITNIKTRLYLIRKQPDKMEPHLSVIENVTDRMRVLVQDLLELSRFERGVIPLHRRDVVLQEVIADVVQVQRPEAERKGLQLYCDLPDDPLHILADPARIAQVVTNLLTNAIHYTYQVGVVQVRLTAEPGTPGYALISVQDTGVGIAPEHVPLIFQPFFRANENSEGSGLGLSIAREIVEMHGGEIIVESEVGGGSCFQVRLALVHGGKP